MQWCQPDLSTQSLRRLSAQDSVLILRVHWQANDSNARKYYVLTSMRKIEYSATPRVESKNVWASWNKKFPNIFIFILRSFKK